MISRLEILFKEQAVRAAVEFYSYINNVGRWVTNENAIISFLACTDLRISITFKANVGYNRGKSGF